MVCNISCCNERLNGMCTLWGFYCRIWAFGIGLPLLIASSVYMGTAPNLSTFGVVAGVTAMLLECSFIFPHCKCCSRLGHALENYMVRAVLYPCLAIIGTIIHYKTVKQPNLFMLLILLGLDGFFFVGAHFQRKRLETYSDSGAFGSGSGKV